MVELRDPRVDGWLLMSSIFPTTAICVAYVYIVKVAGPRCVMLYFTPISTHCIRVSKVRLELYYAEDCTRQCRHCCSNVADWKRINKLFLLSVISGGQTAQQVAKSLVLNIVYCFRIFRIFRVLSLMLSYKVYAGPGAFPDQGSDAGLQLLPDHLQSVDVQ